MNYLHYDLGQKPSGEIVEVTLSGNAANVRLMDNHNFNNYRSGRKHKYYGGYVKKSPVRLAIPHSGHWYIVIDLGGYEGTVNASVRTIKG